MGHRANIGVRLTTAALLIAIAAGCGGGGGGGGALPGDPLAPLPPPGSDPTPVPQVLQWGVFPAARVVVGQPDFFQDDQPDFPIPLDRLKIPSGSPAVTSEGSLIVAHSGSARVFEVYDAVSGPFARFSLNPSRSLSVHGEKLVAVTSNRVEIYNAVPTVSVPPDVSIGTGGCGARNLNAPQAAYLTPHGRLIVADTDNHRVLIWNDITRDPIVIGQLDVIDCAPNRGRPTADERSLNRPTSVWSDDNKLVVVDSGNHRVLIWDTFPGLTARPATRVLGQEDFSSVEANRGQVVPSEFTLSSPGAIDVRATGQFALADTGNQRVLVWDAFPEGALQAPNQLIGQSRFDLRFANDKDQDGDFDDDGAPDARTLRTPVGVRFDGRNLIVVDADNHRVLVFRATN